MLLCMIGTKTELKILKVLTENPFQEFKEIELINAAGTGKGSAGIVIDYLIDKKLINESRAGKTKIISLNTQNHFAFLIRELLNREKLSKMEDKRLAALMLFSNETKSISDLIVVFGSSLAGTHTEESDLDILIATNKIEKVQESRKRIEELFNIRFNLHFYNKYDEFTKSAFLNGVLIHGFETGRNIFLNIKTKKIFDLDRLFFFDERVKSVLRNYNNKDYNAAESIMEKLIEQIIFYLLSEYKINYASRKDAFELIKKTKEGKLIERILKSSLKSKIVQIDELITEILIKKILENEGY